MQSRARESAYRVVGEEHGHGGGHEAVERGDDDDGARDAGGDVARGALHLLGHGGHGVVADVAQVHRGGAVEHPRRAVREEAAARDEACGSARDRRTGRGRRAGRGWRRSVGPPRGTRPTTRCAAIGRDEADGTAVGRLHNTGGDGKRKSG